MFDVVVLYSSTIMTSTRVHKRCTLPGRWRWLEAGDAGLTADNSASKLHGLIATTSMVVVEWKLEPWFDAPPRTHGVARLRFARGVTGDPT